MKNSKNVNVKQFNCHFMFLANYLVYASLHFESAILNEGTLIVAHCILEIRKLAKWKKANNIKTNYKH